MTFRPTSVIVAVALLLSACAGAGAGAGAGAVDGGSSSDILPAATLDVLGEDRSQDIQGLLGDRPLVVNFWASWCSFCIDEMPGLEHVNQEFGGRVRFVGINREDALDEAQRLEVETGVTYPSLIDDDASYFTSVGGRGMPTTLLVSPDGQIRERIAGPITPERLRELLEETFGIDGP